MTGISGWHGQDPASPGNIDAAIRMSTALPGPEEPINMAWPQGAFSCRLESRWLAEDRQSGVYVAIEGAPRWRSGNLVAIAETDGNGKALISAYRSLGRDLFRELYGSFACSIYDLKSNQLLLAVDRMGIRPMCFAVSKSKQLVFASVADSILAHGRISSELSAQSIYNFLYFHVVPSPSTIYDEISKLEPGEYVEFKNGVAQRNFYWSPNVTKNRDIPEDDLGHQLMASMRSSVSRNISDSPTGAFLSGGLDSSTVCGLANECVDQPLQVYSIGFDQDGYDEMDYARTAADHFGLRLREYYVTAEDVAEAMPLIAEVYDEPFGNSSAVPAYFCARLAKSDGIETLLAGDGGDELFAGNERYATQQLFDYYNRIPAFIRKYAIEPAAFRLPTDWSNLTHKMRRYVEQARVDMPERLQTYNFLHMNPPDTVFEPEFLLQVDQSGPITEMATKVNKMCETAGINVKYPLLDDDLVDFSTQIPTNLKLRSRNLRYFFKKTVNGFLPRTIITKKKHGFGLPFGEWLLSSPKLRDATLPSLEKLSNRGIFRRDFVDSLINNHQTVHAAYYGNIIWVLVMLEYWLEVKGQSLEFQRQTKS
jgi:asparagine synthase (glutamine-hydrolysing)